MMDYYLVTIDITSEDAQTTPFSAGDTQFTLSIYWPTAWQELRDILNQNIDNIQRATPLYNRLNKELQRDYDFPSWCHNLVDTDLEMYLADEANLVPYKVCQRPDYSQVVALREYVNAGEQLYQEKSWYEEHLTWQFTLVDASGHTYSGPIRKGAWITDAANGLWELQFRFTSDQLTRESESFELQVGVENGLI